MELKNIDGTVMAFLTPDEQNASDLPSPINPADIDTLDLLDGIDAQEQGLMALQAADDDDITHAQRASIVPKTAELVRDRKAILGMCATLTAWQAEQSLLS